MALITCPECGKSFSDKAEACPNCGCPTKMIVSTNSDSGISSEDAAKQIFDAVSDTKRSMDDAEGLFDSRNDEVQRKASRDIDLFGGHASSRVLEIASDAKRACDDLYATYQSLIPSLDSICRPLLDYNPGMEAIKSVRDMMQLLNEESEIENNYTASLNDTSLGDVVNAKYVPLMENRMIEKFWENQLESTPEYKEKRRKEKEKEERRYEEKKRKEAEQADIEKREYELWKEEVKIAEKKRKEKRVEFENSIKEEFKEAQDRLKIQKDAKASSIREETERLNQRINKCSEEISSLKFFNISKKRELNKEIDSHKKTLRNKEQELADLDSWFANEMKKVEQDKNDSIERIEEKLDDYCPIPLSPEKRKIQEEKEKRKKLLENATPTQRENAKVKEEILLTLSRSGDSMTVTEIMSNMPNTYQVTYQKLSALIRQLVDSGDIEKEIRGKVTAFRITESGQNWL